MRRILQLAMLALAALALTVALASASQAEKRKPLRYVALGDSYSAGSGVQPANPEYPPDCTQSLLNYPKLIAERTGARLRDVTCGGATTGDFFKSQFEDVDPQLDALRRGTQLVTMTIGGNDGGVFIDTITNCAAAGATTAGMGHPCKDQYGNSFVRKIKRNTFPNLVRALRAVHRKSPRARVAILGYLQILPPKDGCFERMPVAEGDVPYLNDIQATLNDAVRRAAKRTGTRYINVTRISRGHDACQEIGTRWIEPVLGGTNPVVVHPNALGERKMADRAMRVLKLR